MDASVLGNAKVAGPRCCAWRPPTSRFPLEPEKERTIAPASAVRAATARSAPPRTGHQAQRIAAPDHGPWRHVGADRRGMNSIDDARQSPARLPALEPALRQTARCPIDRLPVALKQPRRRVCAYEVFRQFFLQCCCRRIEIPRSWPGSKAPRKATTWSPCTPRRSTGISALLRTS